jgi:hypothetical protein
MQDIELLKFEEEVNKAGYAWYGWYWYPRKYLMSFFRDTDRTTLIAKFVVSSPSFMTALCQQVNLRYPNSCHLKNHPVHGYVIERDVVWF